MGIFNRAYDSVASTADHLAGSTDEAFARQFDDQPGGGIADADTWGDAATGGQYSDPNQNIDLFSPSLLGEYATFGATDAEEWESVGVPSAVDTGDLDRDVDVDPSPDRDKTDLGDIVKIVRFAVYAVVIAAILHLIGPLLELTTEVIDEE